MIPDPADLPDLDRQTPPGMTWRAPLMPRPIPLGPSEDRPEVRPALALDADRFWSGARHGLAVGRARIALDAAAIQYALSAQLDRARAEVSALVDAAAAWDRTLSNYSKELTS